MANAILLTWNDVLRGDLFKYTISLKLLVNKILQQREFGQ